MDTFDGLVTITGSEAETYLNFTGPLMDEALDLKESPAQQLAGSITDWWRERGDA
jgi:hypothetical protein